MKILRDNKGHIVIQAMIVMVILYVALVLPLNFSFVQHKRSVLNDVLDKALQRAAVEGGLTDAGRAAILDDLQAKNIDITGATITPSSYTVHERGEIIDISIAVRLNSNLLRGVSAVGGTPPPEGAEMVASGSIMSEYLP